MAPAAWPSGTPSPVSTTVRQNPKGPTASNRSVKCKTVCRVTQNSTPPRRRRRGRWNRQGRAPKVKTQVVQGRREKVLCSLHDETIE